MNESRAPIARCVFGGAMALLGVVHLMFGEGVKRLFPVWPEGLPGRPWWAHIAGAALAVLGSMLILGTRAREAAACIGVLILLAVAALHVPRSIPSGTFGDEWLNVLKWTAMAGGAALVAHGIPGQSGRAIRDRAISWGAAGEKWLLAAFMVGSAILHLRYTEFVATLIPRVSRPVAPRLACRQHFTSGFQSAKRPDGLSRQTHTCRYQMPSEGARLSSCPITVGVARAARPASVLELGDCRSESGRREDSRPPIVSHRNRRPRRASSLTREQEVFGTRNFYCALGG